MAGTLAKLAAAVAVPGSAMGTVAKPE